MDYSNVNKDRVARRKKNTDLSSMIYGKVPPQARELEEAVLGSIMIEKTAFDTVTEILKPDCFYVDGHQKIFKAMQQLATLGQPIDILTVVEALKKNEDLDVVGGAFYITRLTNAVVSAAHVEAHSRIILQKYLQRELIRISGEIISDAYEDSTDVFDLLDKAEGDLFELVKNNLGKSFEPIDSVLISQYKRIEELRSRKSDITGVPSGFRELDKLTSGWQPTDLIILAARPSVGKTAFALNLARNAAMNPINPVGVAVFSLEMSAGQLVQRVLSAESEIPMGDITKGKLADHQMKQLYTKGLQPLAQAPMYIDDTAALNIFELRAKCRRLKNKNNIGLIIIDYLQLMSGSSDNKNSNREQEISNISRNLKALAKELHVPIIALSQMSRDVEKRGSKDGSRRPMLSDLRESGAIEQDADMVMFLYRPEYYDVTQDAQGENTKGLTEVMVQKHRNGELGTIKLNALLHIQKFLDWDSDPYSTSFPGEGKWKQIGSNDENSGLYIQTGSKMNDQNTDDEPF